jgi:type II secretory pathway predicted ATPase ExeA
MAEVAAAILEERKISVSEILAAAYSQVSGQVELHEKKLAETETRRRRLREDYDRLRAARAKPVEDAEILEG